MSFKLRPAVEDDCVPISRIAKDAFPRMSAILFPTHLKTEENKNHEVSWRADRTLARMKNGMPTVVAVEVDENTGKELKIVAFSSWQKPRSANEQALQFDQVHHIVPPPLSMDKGASNAIVEVLRSQEARILGESASDTWSPNSDEMLQFVCFWQSIRRIIVGGSGHGYFAGVLRWGLDQAAAEGKKAFLTASRKGRDLYVSQGMREVGVDVVWGEEPHYAMLYGGQCGTQNPDVEQVDGQEKTSE